MKLFSRKISQIPFFLFEFLPLLGFKKFWKRFTRISLENNNSASRVVFWFDATSTGFLKKMTSGLECKLHTTAEFSRSFLFILWRISSSYPTLLDDSRQANNGSSSCGTLEHTIVSNGSWQPLFLLVQASIWNSGNIQI